MNRLRILLCLLFVICLASLAEAGRRSSSASCDCANGVCSTTQPVEVAAVKVKGWPWSKPAPAPAPAPTVVVPPAACTPAAPEACTAADQLTVEVPDRPGRHVLSATVAVVVKAPIKLAAVAVRIPVRAGAAVLKCPLRLLAAGHERRAARRYDRRGGN